MGTTYMTNHAAAYHALRDLRCAFSEGERYVLVPESQKRLMLVPDEMRKSVAFLWFRKNGEFRPAGTAFFVGWAFDPGDRTSLGVRFWLTADHVIKGIKRESDDGVVLFRMNTRDGGARWIETTADDWVQVDPRVDAAALFWTPADELDLDLREWQINWGDLGELYAANGVGIGDEVFMVGLFRNHLGKDRNEPIVRVGNIAAIPVDPIRTMAYGDMQTVLVEARSIGGLSGSPVFIHLGFTRWSEGTLKQWVPEGNLVGPFLILGLVHGHWDALEADVDLFDGQERVNMGVVIVTPMKVIVDALRRTMEGIGKDMTEKQQAEQEPTQDAATADDEYARFDDLLGELVNTPKPKPEDKE